jgi:hypothetical protein
MCHLQFITYWLSYAPHDCNLLVCGIPYSGVNTPKFQRNLLPVSSQMMSNKFLFFLSLFFALQNHSLPKRIHSYSYLCHCISTLPKLSLVFRSYGNTLYCSVECGRYSDSLRAGLSGDRISEKLRYSTPVQTGSGAHSLLSDELPGLFLGGKAAGSWR